MMTKRAVRHLFGSIASFLILLLYMFEGGRSYYVAYGFLEIAYLVFCLFDASGSKIELIMMMVLIFSAGILQSALFRTMLGLKAFPVLRFILTVFPFVQFVFSIAGLIRMRDQRKDLQAEKTENGPVRVRPMNTRDEKAFYGQEYQAKVQEPARSYSYSKHSMIQDELKPHSGMSQPFQTDLNSFPSGKRPEDSGKTESSAPQDAAAPRDPGINVRKKILEKHAERKANAVSGWIEHAALEETARLNQTLFVIYEISLTGLFRDLLKEDGYAFSDGSEQFVRIAGDSETGYHVKISDSELCEAFTSRIQNSLKRKGIQAGCYLACLRTGTVQDQVLSAQSANGRTIDFSRIMADQNLKEIIPGMQETVSAASSADDPGIIVAAKIFVGTQPGALVFEQQLHRMIVRKAAG